MLYQLQHDLSSLVQSQHDIEIKIKVPAAAVDEFKAAGITGVLVSLKEKAEGAEGNAKHVRAIVSCWRSSCLM